MTMFLVTPAIVVLLLLAASCTVRRAQRMRHPARANQAVTTAT
jgi:hypothetical protein